MLVFNFILNKIVWKILVFIAQTRTSHSLKMPSVSSCNDYRALSRPVMSIDVNKSKRWWELNYHQGSKTVSQLFPFISYPATYQPQNCFQDQNSNLGSLEVGRILVCNTFLGSVLVSSSYCLSNYFTEILIYWCYSKDLKAFSIPSEWKFHATMKFTHLVSVHLWYMIVLDYRGVLVVYAYRKKMCQTEDHK